MTLFGMKRVRGSVGVWEHATLGVRKEGREAEDEPNATIPSIDAILWMSI